MKEVLAQLLLQVEALQASLDVEVKAAHDAGFSEGVASVVVGEKIYSQAEVDALIIPLNAKIIELEVIASGVDVKIAGEVLKLKADLLAAYESALVSESAVETGFKELLK